SLDSSAESGSLLGLESTSFGDAAASDIGRGLEIESTSLLETPAPPAEPPRPNEPRKSAMLDFIMPDGAEIASTPEPSADLPLLDGGLDLDLPAVSASSGAAAAADLPLIDAGLDDLAAPPLPDPRLANAR